MKIRAAFICVIAVLAVALASPAGASDFGYIGGAYSRWGDYGSGHAASSWGEGEHRHSFCFDSTVSTAGNLRSDLEYGFMSIDDDAPSNMTFAKEACGTHTDVVFIEGNPPGDSTLTWAPVNNIYGVTDQWWVIMDSARAFQNAYVHVLNGGTCNGFDCFAWEAHYLGAAGAAIGLGVRPSTENDVMKDTFPGWGSWTIFTLSPHNRVHVALWNN